MTEERFWLLVSLKMSGEATEADLLELEAHLQREPNLRLKVSIMEQNWRAKKGSRLSKDDAYNRHLQRLSQQLNQDQQWPSIKPVPEEGQQDNPRPRIIRRLLWVSGVAASLLLAWSLLGNPFDFLQKEKDPAHNSISTRRGSKTKVELPDGTQVWLNADSRITYNEEFQGKIREVNLSGEAYFDVVRDEDRPFVIHTDVIDIRVLGTAFNVRSYADEENTETSLIRGSVEVTLRNHPERKFTLKPNDKLIVNNAEAAPVAENPAPEKPSSREIVLTWGKVNYPSQADTVATEAMWTRNKLAFDKKTLEEIAITLERWYDITVDIQNERIKTTEFSLTIEDESLQQVMEALREAGKFRYSIDKKKLTIW